MPLQIPINTKLKLQQEYIQVALQSFPHCSNCNFFIYLDYNLSSLVSRKILIFYFNFYVNFIIILRVDLVSS